MGRLRLAAAILGALGLAFLFGLAGAWYLGNGADGSGEGSQNLAGGLERPPGGRFVLSDQEGRPVDSAALGDRYLVLYFGYSQCSDACPVAMAGISGALDRLGPAELSRVAPLFVTIDPLVDQAPQLAAYLEGFHPALRALTGEAEQVAEAAAAFRVGYDPEAAESESGLRIIEHGTFIYLMGPDGAFLRRFDYDVASERLAEVLRGYLSVEPSG